MIQPITVAGPQVSRERLIGSLPISTPCLYPLALVPPWTGLGLSPTWTLVVIHAHPAPYLTVYVSHQAR